MIISGHSQGPPSRAGAIKAHGSHSSTGKSGPEANLWPPAIDTQGSYPTQTQKQKQEPVEPTPVAEPPLEEPAYEHPVARKGLAQPVGRLLSDSDSSSSISSSDESSEG